MHIHMFDIIEWKYINYNKTSLKTYFLNNNHKKNRKIYNIENFYIRMTTDNLVNSSSSTTTKANGGLIKPDPSTKSVNFTVTTNNHKQSNGTTKNSHYNTSFNKSNSSNSKNKKVFNFNSLIFYLFFKK